MKLEVRTLLTLAVAVLLTTRISGHGLCTDPRQRGALRENKGLLMDDPGFPEKLEQDWTPHFPAGDKTGRPGSGLDSQKKVGGPYKPFDPFNPSYRWRSGVCGDEPGVNDHLKGGKYYNDGIIVRNYTQGQVVDMTISIKAHHNGYVLAFICDVGRCSRETSSNDISKECFLKGYCHQMMREPIPECDENRSKKCGPIDPNYPGRWYLPCSSYGGRSGSPAELFGGPFMKYRLPAGLTCDHCVILWHWAAANTCVPEGMQAYFDGPNAPTNWGDCPGQGGAVGGIPRGGPNWNKTTCGGDAATEEYYQCSDVSVAASSRPETSSTEPPPVTTAVSVTTIQNLRTEAEIPSSTSTADHAGTSSADSATPKISPLRSSAAPEDRDIPPPEETVATSGPPSTTLTPTTIVATQQDTTTSEQPSKSSSPGSGDESMYVDLIPVGQNAARPGKRISPGDVICPDDFKDGFSVACRAPPGTQQVKFTVNGSPERAEYVAPFTIRGDLDGVVRPWKNFPEEAKITCETGSGLLIEASITFRC